MVWSGRSVLAIASPYLLPIGYLTSLLLPSFILLTLSRLGFVFKVGPHCIIDSASIQKPGASSPILAEAQALYHGLSWCLSSQLLPRFVFSDCLNLVSKVNSIWKDNSVLSSLVAQIRLSFSNFPGVSFLHLPRKLNRSVHSLAKEAIRMREDDHEDSL
ncbi:hypothetical protein G4B88_028517 [Cannabis sativa]|uniref:RNase H type-1 domain-containing protein n=1 Tax=Cannabis sativa TaxID=3483 RepID=A0A7J6GNE8_CANSA|nr:hypothetical protein G4B88_028517 [Cannabis sativa]